MEINEQVQLDLLRYIRTKPKLFAMFHKDAWDSAIGVAYNVLDVYNKKYGTMPTNFDTVYMFLNDYAATLHTDSETLFGDVSSVIRHVFEQPNLDASYLESIARTTAHKLQAFAIFNKHLVSMTSYESDFDINTMVRELHKLTVIEDDTVERRRLLADIAMTAKTLNLDKIFRSSLEELNAWRNKGGFYAPELYVLAAPPKALKTMTLLNLGLDFALNNKINILYVDTENGVSNIHQRGAQNITSSTYANYSLDEATETAVKMLQEYGCDLYIIGFRPGQANYRDIEDELDRLAGEGITISGIVYDYADNMVPLVKTQKQHENAAQVYLDLIGVNIKYKTFAWTASQIKAEFVKNGKYIEKGSLGQAIAKEHHAHGVFSLLGTREERALGLRRLAPIAHREGVEDDNGDHMIYIQVDPATQRILGSISKEEVEEMLANAESNDSSSPKADEFTFIPKQKFESLNDR